MFFKRKIKSKYRQKLKNIKNKFEQKQNIEKNKIISILNHDVKTPILAQNQSLKFLLEGGFGSLDEKQEELLREVYNSNNFLLEVILNSIFLTKYENEKPKLNLEKINIVDEVEDCCKSVKKFALEKQQNIIFKTNIPENTKLSADRKLIQKIIFNIVQSSVNYGFENSDIEILLKDDKDSISFCAKNKSIYMTKEKIKSLFEDKKDLSDFNQLGMHLNLNIAKKLINAHNWEVIAQSEKDNSSVFGFVVKK